MHLAYHLGRISVEKGWEFYLYTPQRLSIDRMRNEAAKFALERDCDYLMFVDDDMLIKPETVEFLVDADKDIVMAETYIRGYPFDPMFFKERSKYINAKGQAIYDLEFFKDFKDHVNDKGIVDCAAIGFATALIKTKVIKELDPPYFVTGPNCTEDVYFCLKARQELSWEPTIAVDTRCPTSHRLQPEFVDADNVKDLREYFKPKYDEDERGDRANTYHEMISKI